MFAILFRLTRRTWYSGDRVYLEHGNTADINTGVTRHPKRTQNRKSEPQLRTRNFIEGQSAGARVHLSTQDDTNLASVKIPGPHFPALFFGVDTPNSARGRKSLNQVRSEYQPSEGADYDHQVTYNPA